MTTALVRPPSRATGSRIDSALSVYWMSKEAPIAGLSTERSLPSELTSTEPSAELVAKKPGATMPPAASITRAPVGTAV